MLRLDIIPGNHYGLAASRADYAATKPTFLAIQFTPRFAAILIAKRGIDPLRKSQPQVGGFGVVGPAPRRRECRCQLEQRLRGEVVSTAPHLALPASVHRRRQIRPRTTPPAASLGGCCVPGVR